MYIKRDISEHILMGARQMPVVAIIGPRQSGKSTLARELFKNHTYLDMQDAQLCEFAQLDPKGFLASYPSEYGLILDEVQYAPALFSQIKVAADQNPRPGYYILSGSQNFLLHEKISESLAGRVYFYVLLPLSIHELKASGRLAPSPTDQIQKGFYPRVYHSALDSTQYYDNYIATYVERDIRSIRNIDNILTFKRFMQLCALRVGTQLNLSDLATSCGISTITAKSWLSLLETSFVLFFLPPYHDNLGRRLIKSPKLYFYDVGLAMALMDIDRDMLVAKRDVYGALFENMVIVDILKNFHARGVRRTLTFFRDSNQNEIDLIIEYATNPLPIEIKSSLMANQKFFDTLTWFRTNVPDSQEAVVIYAGEQAIETSAGRLVPWTALDVLCGGELKF